VLIKLGHEIAYCLLKSLFLYLCVICGACVPPLFVCIRNDSDVPLFFCLSAMVHVNLDTKVLTMHTYCGPCAKVICLFIKKKKKLNSKISKTDKLQKTNVFFSYQGRQDSTSHIKVDKMMVFC
jgi:thiol-disulfide isomerase/thioredoxin